MNMDLLWQYVAKWSRQKPDDEAIVSGDTRLSWRELEQLMDQSAEAFLADGVQRGDRVAMIAAACPEFLITFMAASKVGAIWLGLSPKSTLRELRILLEDSRPTVLITTREFLGRDFKEDIQTLQKEFTFMRKVLVLGDTFDGAESYTDSIATRPTQASEALRDRCAQGSPSDDVLLMYTSGSTGKPKGVVQTHRSIIANIEIEVRHFALRTSGRILLHFPINHVAASVEIGFAAIMSGSATIMMDKFDPVESLRMIQKERITLFGQVPAMFLMQFATPIFKDVDWSSVETFAWSGSSATHLVVDVLSRICARTGARQLTGYGSTELCGFVTYSEPDLDLTVLMKTAGRIADQFEMKIVDEHRTRLPYGVVGEVAVRGPIVMKGYFNRPDLTASVIDDDGWYYTSDLGAMDDRGNLTLSGRKSEMYKTGGENVFPREIEEVLELHPSVLFSAVIGVPDTKFQEVGRAFVMPKPGMSLSEEDLRSLCKEHLTNFKVPKQFEIRPLLPMLPNGKVNKMALREDLQRP